MINYKWKISPEINQLLIELESIKFLINQLPTKQYIEEGLRTHSLLKSAVYSARIEGFSDTLNSPKKESQNLLSAYHLIFSNQSPHKLSLVFIKKLHQRVLKNIISNPGKWRTEPWAIFNQAGAAIYLAPPHFEVPELMNEYIKFINSITDHPAVKSAIAQFIFEKIHPFADGNGRVGRLISAHILQKNGFGFKGQVPFEEYIDKHREDYYYFLESSTDCSGFIKYLLQALVTKSKEYLEELNTPDYDKPELSLLPRRREILEIIRNHPNCSFDFLKRRFVKVNPKTLHYDLSQLLKANFVKKLGSTRGSLYFAK